MAALHAFNKYCHPVLFPLQVFAGFLLIASAATIGFIENNEALEALRDFDGMMNLWL